MSLLPLDIQNKTFDHQMRGYNKDEVDDFLDQVGRNYEELIQKNHELEKSLKNLNEKLDYFNELKDALNQSIIIAQETADKVKNNASTVADQITKNANQEAAMILDQTKNHAQQILIDTKNRAEKILNKAINDTKNLTDETEQLKHSSRKFHSRLLLMLESELQAVGSKEWDELLAPVATDLPSASELLKEILDKSTFEELKSSLKLDQVEATLEKKEKKEETEEVAEEAPVSVEFDSLVAATPKEEAPVSVSFTDLSTAIEETVKESL